MGFTAQTAQKVKYLLWNVAYRATVYKTGICILLLQMYIVRGVSIWYASFGIILGLKKKDLWLTYYHKIQIIKKCYHDFANASHSTKFSFVQAFFKQSKKVLFKNRISLIYCQNYNYNCNLLHISKDASKRHKVNWKTCAMDMIIFLDFGISI